MEKLLSIILITSALFADTVYYKNGDILDNCQVIKQDSSMVTVQYMLNKDMITYNIRAYLVDHIEEKEYNLDLEVEQIRAGKPIQDVYSPSLSGETLKFNIKALPVTIIGGILGYDYLTAAINKSKEIEYAENQLDIYQHEIELYSDNSQEYLDLVESSISNQKMIIKLNKKQKQQYQIRSVLFLSAAVLNTVFAMEKIDIEPVQDGVALSFKF